MKPDPDELVTLALTDEEVSVLSKGLDQWGGPDDCSDEMAVAMGFENRWNLYAESRRISHALLSRQAMTRFDWTRALLATEVDFASDVMGAGCEWSTVTGLDDLETLELLRGIQSKLVGTRVPIGTRMPRP